jgi:hypothetical protein
VAAGGRQRADQVDVDVGETAVRNRYLCWLWVDVFANLAALAKQARPGHECYGFGHLGPAELGGDEAVCRPYPGVMNGV